MSYSDISGLELFQIPFGSNPARQPQAYNHQDTAKRQTVADAKAPQQQSGRQTAVQQPVSSKPPVKSAKQAEASAVQELKNCNPDNTVKPVKDPAPQKVSEKAAKPVQAQKTQVSADNQKQNKASQKELVLDMSSGSGADTGGRLNTADDTEKRKAHEAAEAKRKAEWEAKQLAKKQAEEEAIQKLQSMSDEEAVAASTRRISTDVERITRRNLKECVADHIQNLCRKDPAFARLTIHPCKSMSHCFMYINRIAKDFVQKEMKYRDARPENGIYGCDVPDGLVYQWAEDYYYDADAPEDQKKEEQFVPCPYVNTQTKSKSAASKPKNTAKAKQKETESENYEQMSFV